MFALAKFPINESNCSCSTFGAALSNSILLIVALWPSRLRCVALRAVPELVNSLSPVAVRHPASSNTRGFW